MIRPVRACLAACVLALAACAEGPPKALGTLEYDRITVPAPVAERIVSIEAREGEHVTAGTLLMTLDRTRVEAETQATQAEAQRQRDALAELEAGPRSEQILKARASLAALALRRRDRRRRTEVSAVRRRLCNPTHRRRLGGTRIVRWGQRSGPRAAHSDTHVGRDGCDGRFGGALFDESETPRPSPRFVLVGSDAMRRGRT